MIKDACISDCGKYRYSLSRTWDEDKFHMLFVMLNPSTADAEKDDPTIRRCIAFAKREGYGGIRVVNLFALRATDPAELKKAEDPVGPENDDYLCHEFVRCSGLHVFAYGNHGSLMNRDKEVYELIGSSFSKCLGLTGKGLPKHPLYVKGDTPLEEMLQRGA